MTDQPDDPNRGQEFGGTDRRRGGDRRKRERRVRQFPVEHDRRSGEDRRSGIDRRKQR